MDRFTEMTQQMTELLKKNNPEMLSASTRKSLLKSLRPIRTEMDSLYKQMQNQEPELKKCDVQMTPIYKHMLEMLIMIGMAIVVLENG